MVEGSTDSRLFQKFAEPKGCLIIVCHGWERLVQAITILSDMSFDGALGYCDRDYFDYIGYPNYRGDIIFTDENDLEVQILQSDALQSVLREFGIKDRIDAEMNALGKCPCELILDWAAEVSCLRLAAALNSWSLRFDGMHYKFEDANSPCIDMKATVQHVVGRSDRSQLPKESEIEQAARELIASHGIRGVTNGHDCVAVFARALRRRFGNTSRFNSPNGHKELSSILRIAYEYAYFQTTSGFHEIRRWEKATGFVVLKTA